MRNLRVLLPHELELFIHRQVSDGRYPSAGDYVCTLIREARLETARQILTEAHRDHGIRRRALPGGPEP